MYKLKKGIIAILLITIISLSSILIAETITENNSAIQGGTYFTNLNYIKIPNPTNNMNLQDAIIEDYYSQTVNNIYEQNTIIYCAGNIEFSYNVDENGNFINGFIVKSSDRTANFDYEKDDQLQFNYNDIIVEDFNSESTFNQSISQYFNEDIMYTDLINYVQ